MQSNTKHYRCDKFDFSTDEMASNSVTQVSVGFALQVLFIAAITVMAVMK